VCKKFTPEELRKSISLVFAKWAQCDRCSYWVHLVFILVHFFKIKCHDNYNDHNRNKYI
jgi:hypothetical protein